MIVGVSGTLGAGKGTVVQYLVSHYGFVHYSVRAYLEKEIEKRGLVINRDTLVLIANEIRSAHGAGYITEQLLGNALHAEANSVIESIRSVGEAMYLKSHGAKIWAVDADVHTRYGRITQRASATDHVSFEKFVADEQREFTNDDPAKQNISGVIALADVLLYNDGSYEDLYQEIEEAMK